MSVIVRYSVRAVAIALVCVGTMSAAPAQEEWKALSGEALWDQAGRYGNMYWYRETRDSLDKYLGGGVGSAGFSPSPGGGGCVPCTWLTYP
jgi:hypothetical protein